MLCNRAYHRIYAFPKITLHVYVMIFQKWLSPSGPELERKFLTFHAFVPIMIQAVYIHIIHMRESPKKISIVSDTSTIHKNSSNMIITIINIIIIVELNCC